MRLTFCDCFEFDTCDQFWDCDCQKNFIHRKTETLYCEKCEAYEEDHSDSRVPEILKAGYLKLTMSEMIQLLRKRKERLGANE